MQLASLKSKSPQLEKLRGIAAYGLGPILGLLSGPILAHSLGPSGRGQFAAVMQPISVAAAIASFGIPTAVTYFVARGWHPRETLRSALLLCAPFAATTYLVMAWYSGVVSSVQGLNRVLILTAWTAIGASAVVQIYRAYWQGLADWKRLDRERAFFAVARFIAVCGIALAGVSVAGPYVGGALGAFIAAALLLWIPSRERNHRGEKPPVRQIFGYSASASLGTISVVANSRLDQVLMPAFTSSEQLGFYSIAVTVAEVPIIFGTLAARNSLHSAASGKTWREHWLDVRIYLCCGLATCALAAILARPLVPLVFGTDFSPSIVSVQILSASTAIAILTMTAIPIIAGMGYPMLSSVLPFGGAMVTILLFVYFRDSINSVGASVISLTSQCVTLAIGLITIGFLLKRVKSA